MLRSITRFVHAAPWLMLAASLRIIYATGDGLMEQGAFVAANVAIFLAFLIVSHQMIELADGRTAIGTMGLGKQIAVGRNIMLRVMLLLTGISIVVAWLGAPGLAGHLLYGFDGMAFDQSSSVGILLSSVLAALVLLMVLAAERGQRATILAALRELTARRGSLLPAVAATAVFLLFLSAVQGLVREMVQQLWQTSSVPYTMRAYVYFVFIFSFATLRLCGSVAILVFALRRSYRSGSGSSGAATVMRGTDPL